MKFLVSCSFGNRVFHASMLSVAILLGLLAVQSPAPVLIDDDAADGDAGATEMFFEAGSLVEKSPPRAGGADVETDEPTGRDDELMMLLEARKQVVEENTISPDMWSRMVQAELEAGGEDWREASAYIRSILLDVPDHPFTLRKGANLFLASGILDWSQECVDKLLETQAENPNLLKQRSITSLLQGRTDEAVEFAKRALDAVPAPQDLPFSPDPVVRLVLAASSYKQGNDESVAVSLGRLSLPDQIRLCSWLAAHHDGVTNAVGELGYDTLASFVLGGGRDKGELHKIVEVEETEADASKGQVDTLEAEGFATTSDQLRSAEKALRSVNLALVNGAYEGVDNAFAAVEKAGASGAWLELAKAAIMDGRGNSSEAQAQYREVLRKAPDVIDAYMRYAVSAMSGKEYERATVILQDAEVVAPRRLDVQILKAASLINERKIDEGWPIMARIATSYPALFAEWMRGDDPFYDAIRNLPEYQALRKKMKASGP